MKLVQSFKGNRKLRFLSKLLVKYVKPIYIRYSWPNTFEKLGRALGPFIGYDIFHTLCFELRVSCPLCYCNTDIAMMYKRCIVLLQ